MPGDPSVQRAGRERAGSPTDRAQAAVPENQITLPIAGLTWLIGWLAGNLLGSAVLAASGYANEDVADRPAWVAVSMSVALWVPQLVALVVVSRRYASGDPLRDYSLRFRPIDLLGIPIGILSQIGLLRLVYWPLESIWPQTFGDKKLEQNARDLYNSANGGWIVALVLVIIVGAPFVEELVYRGLLQGAARRRFDDVVAVVLVAAFFALIHFRPVEFPGLFMFGLVLGTCACLTNRLGMNIAAHAAFNATALFLVAR